MQRRTEVADLSKTACFLQGSRPRCLAPAFALLLLLLALADLAPPAYSQQASASGAIRVAVVGPDGNVLRTQAVVKLSNPSQHSSNWQTTGEASDTTFQGLAQGKYEIEASAVGYLSGHQEVELTGDANPVEVKVVVERDPSAIGIHNNDAAMPRKAREVMKRGEKALESGNLKSAEKLLNDADKLAPDNANLKFLEGYVAMKNGELGPAQAYLIQATKLDPHFGRALTLLGRIQLGSAQYAEATNTLQQAVAADPANWVAHHLLAHAYLQQQQWEEARQQAELAIVKGGKDGTFALFALGVALAELGKNAEAGDAFRSFRQAQPLSSAAPEAQRWLAALHQPAPDVLVDPLIEMDAPVTRAAPSPIVMPPIVTAKTLASSWEPPGVDESMPPVAAGTNCPLQQVLEQAGERTEEFVQDAGKFAAIETVADERLDEMGNVGSRSVHKFDYTAALSQVHDDVVQVDEYRTQRYDLDREQDTFVDNGFAALTLVFHPAMRDGFLMQCEGLGSWAGQATWLVHFQQRSDRPSRLQTFRAGDSTYPVPLKGRAWISAESFQIVRIESELVSPVPQIQLFAEHDIAEYAPVNFPDHHVELWLPKTAEIYLAYRGGRYHRRHSFNDYMLFSVDTQEEVRGANDGPGGVPASSKSQMQRVSPN